jgi:serine/threonine-protein kinase RsbW
MPTSTTQQTDQTTAGETDSTTSFTYPCREVYLRRTAQVTPLLDAVLAAMDKQGYTPANCRELRLVLEEAIVNGLKHGNGGDPAKRVRVRYRVGPEAVVAEIEDEGPGFDPARVPDPTALENLDKPSGRGLLLMQHYTNWLCYSGRGNHLTFCKYRDSE